MATPEASPQKPRASVRGSSQSLTSALSSRSSTFRGLVNSKNIKQKALPKFLRDDKAAVRPSLTLPFGPQSESGTESLEMLHSAEEMSLLSSHFSSLKPRSMFTPSPQRPLKLPHEPSPESDLTARREAKAEELLLEVKQGLGESREEVFCIKGESFTREELGKVLGESEVPRKAMQAFLKAMNQENRRMMDVQSVKIFSIAFTQQIFSKGKASTLHSKSDPLKYEYPPHSLLLFPIYVGYWTLLVVNSRDRSVLYLDPLKRYSYMDGLLVALLQFLKGELVHHLHKRIEHTAWRDIFYRENKETQRFTHAEAPFYVLKHAQGFAKGEHRDLTNRDLVNFGEMVLKSVIRLGVSMGA